MEEEIELERMSNNTYYDDYDFEMVQSHSPVYYWIVLILDVLFSIVGIICDVIIIRVVQREQRLKTRTFLLIMNWAISDAVMLTLTPSLIRFFFTELEVRSGSKFTMCLLGYVDITFHLTAYICILALISTYIMKSNKISNKIILGVIYGITGFLTIFDISFCISERHRVPMLGFTAAFTFLLVNIMMILKELNVCMRRRRPVSAKTRFRLNVAGIYTLNWAIVFLAMIFQFYIYGFKVIEDYIVMSARISSFYILLYMFYNHVDFEMGILRLFKRDNNEYIVEFDEDDENDLNVHVDQNTEVH